MCSEKESKFLQQALQKWRWKDLSTYSFTDTVFIKLRLYNLPRPLAGIKEADSPFRNLTFKDLEFRLDFYLTKVLLNLDSLNAILKYLRRHFRLKSTGYKVTISEQFACLCLIPLIIPDLPRINPHTVKRTARTEKFRFDDQRRA